MEREHIGSTGRRLMEWLCMAIRARRATRFYTMSPDGKLIRGSGRMNRPRKA